MTDNIISLADKREARERPDWQFIEVDEEGRELFCYSISYTMPNGESRSSFMWAHSEQDVHDRVEGMKASLVVNGKVIREVRG